MGQALGVSKFCRRGSLQRVRASLGLENMANNDSGTFLTVAEVAELMRVSKMTVYRLVHSGELPAVRVGRSFRVHEQAVEEYLGASIYEAGQTG
jgi:excisionase family DNA binding protein